MSPGGGMGAMGAPMAGGGDPFSGCPVPSADSGSFGGVTIPEMTALRDWEEKHERELEDKMRAEEVEKKEKRTKAEAEVKQYYEERKTNITKKMQSNRQEEETLEKARADSMKPGANPWERIVDLIDTNAQAGDTFRDTSRMRSLLISLKSAPPVAAH